ncbi:DUF6378 domain-containing protein [Streptomyces sp. NPDC093261]|uniref:DUF6378 domain-containing protein n=1 Tax=Streptomyces sp. NPDC093261 TaxID=3366037 RepID=UPI00380C53BF
MADHEHCPDCACCGQKPKPLTVEQEAALLTRDGDRQRTYGHPREDYTRVAWMWSAILGAEVTAEQAALCMVAVKISRLCHTPEHRDSVVDLIGYGIVYDRIVREDPE